MGSMLEEPYGIVRNHIEATMRWAEAENEVILFRMEATSKTGG